MLNKISHSLKLVIQKLIYGSFENKIAKGSIIITQQELRTSQETHFYDTKAPLHIENIHYKIVGTEKTPTWIPDFTIPRLYLGSSYSMIQNALLVGKHGTVIFNGKIVMDSILNSIGYLINKSEKRLIRFHRWLPIKKSYDLGISLANCLSNSYFHWLGETLPMLESYEKYTATNPDSNPVIFVNKNPPRFVIEYLALMGIKKNRIVNLSSSKIIVKSLIVPSTRFFALKNNHDYWNRHIYPKSAFDYLRKKLLLKTQNTNQPSKIYLSRKYAELRSVCNEADIIPIVEENGFKVMNMEDWSVAEQIAIFQNLTHLITPHGAGLTNILFSTQLKIIELYPKTRAFGYNYHYYQLSSQYQHHHTLLLCECDENQNMTVESDQLDKIINDK